MTIQELVDWCRANDVDMETTHIAVRAKDDYFITEETVYMDIPYFGNCKNGGWEWLNDNTPLGEDEDPDYDSAPQVLILDSLN